jgi:O-antigen/teichoic acid export membrane protein
MAESLKSQTAVCVVWSAVQRFGSLAISFITSIILAQLLKPKDYGAIGVLTILIALSLTFIAGGVGSALTQKNPTHYNRKWLNKR